MQQVERGQFDAMCATSELFLGEYNRYRWLPAYLFRLWHKREGQVAEIVGGVEILKASTTTQTTLRQAKDDIIRFLLNQYYFLSVHTVSKRLRSLVQDALLACLSFTASDVLVYHDLIETKHDVPAYLMHFLKRQELTSYRQYFARRHAIYGVPARRINPAELTLIAKGGLIHGLLVQRYGVHRIILMGFHFVKDELLDLLKNHIFVGFLTRDSLEGYLHKIHLLFGSCEEYLKTNIPGVSDFERITPEFETTSPHAGTQHYHNKIPDFLHYEKRVDTAGLIQNARYLLENIINAAGVQLLGPAQHPEHAVLIASCYWVDEFLQQAQAELDVA